MITIHQAKNYQTRRKNIEKYIAPFPWISIMNILNCFLVFVIGRNNDELCRQYSLLNNLLYPQVSVHTNEISSHTIIISAKNTNVSIVKLLRFQFKNGMRFVIYTRTENIIYHLVGINHLMCNGYFRNIIEKQQHCVLNTTHEFEFRIMHFQKSS